MQLHKCQVESNFSSEKVEAWLRRINGMGAAEEVRRQKRVVVVVVSHVCGRQLDEASSRQMLYELGQSYDSFHKSLK